MSRYGRRVAALAGALLVPLPAIGQTTFEGVVTTKMTAAGMTMDMVQYVKGSRIRQESAGTGFQAIMLLDADKGSMIMLMPEQKQWMDMAAMMRAMAGMRRGGAAEQTAAGTIPEIKSTGQKETIIGHECEHYAFATGGAEIDVCVAKGLGYHFGGSGGGMGMDRDRQPGMPSLSAEQIRQWREIFKEGYFPLRTTVRQSGQVMVMEVTKIERKTLADELFVPPPDYKEVRSPGDAAFRANRSAADRREFAPSLPLPLKLAPALIP